MARKPRVRRTDLEKIMLHILKDCGVGKSTAKLIHKRLVHRFMEEFVAAVLDRDGVELRGLIIGRRIKHKDAKNNFVVKLHGTMPGYKGGKDGFDFESCVDR